MDRRDAQLRYARPSALTTCPDEAALADAVSARLGYVPFTNDAELVISVTIAIDSDQSLVATIEARHPSSDRPKRRVLRTAPGDCRELADSMALTISVAIDPMSLTPKSEPVALAPPPAPAPPPMVEEPPPPAPPEVAREVQAPATHVAAPALPIRFGVGQSADVGRSVGATGGNFAMLELVMGAFSIALEPSISWPVAGSGARSAVHMWTVGTEIVPCYAPTLVRVCGVLAVAQVRARGDGVDTPREDSMVSAALGPAVGVAVPLMGPLSLLGRLETMVAVLRPEAEVNAVPVWRAPWISVAGRVALVLEIL